ncbi:hypothetical protein YQE_00807, partial [Dendroctonus ponderosae]
VAQAVKDAIDAGYRHIDCALYYLNEEEVGAGIKAKIDEGVVKREELFVTSKLWCNLMRPDLSLDIVITAYSPLGSPDRPWAKPGDPILVKEPKILALAEKYKKTPAQIILRYLHQLGVVPIPKSVTKSRIAENLDIWDFQLNAADVAVLDTFDCNGRVCQHSEGAGHPNHPFENDEW